MVAFFSQGKTFGEDFTILSLPVLFQIFLVDISSRTLFPLFKPGSVHSGSLDWGTAAKEIMVPFVENPESKGSPFKAWSRLVHSHGLYAY